MSKEYMLHCPYYPDACRKWPGECDNCEEQEKKDKPITQYDRLMSEMTVEKMAQYRTKTEFGLGVCSDPECYDNDAGKYEYSDDGYDNAIAAEIEYLKSEVRL